MSSTMSNDITINRVSATWYAWGRQDAEHNPLVDVFAFADFYVAQRATAGQSIQDAFTTYVASVTPSRIRTSGVSTVKALRCLAHRLRVRPSLGPPGLWPLGDARAPDEQRLGLPLRGARVPHVPHLAAVRPAGP